MKKARAPALASYKRRRSERGECVEQRLVLLRRADADAQELSDARLLEVAHDHPLLTQRSGYASCVTLRVASKMKLAAEGSTSKPSACIPATTFSRLSITQAQVCSK